MSSLSRPLLSTPKAPAFDDDELYVVRANRTAIKEDIGDLKRLIVQLIELGPVKFARVTTLEDDQREAIEEYHRIPSYSAKKRQLQTINRMMVGVDRAAIRKELLKIDHLAKRARAKAAAESAPKGETELLIDRLLEGGDDAVFALGEANESYDRDLLKALRQAVRQAKKQLAAGKPRAGAVKGVAAALANLAPTVSPAP